jgi:radical SAM protein with 4Fe4S-binding SPASM domain
MVSATMNDIWRFIEQTREVVYLREIDRLLIIRPNRIQHLNESAFEMLDLLYNKKKFPSEIINELSGKYRMSSQDLMSDLTALVKSINAIMEEDYSSAPMIDTIAFDPDSIKFPVLSEIALTYRCQNRCDFCYASSPYRGERDKEMTTDEVKRVIEKIHGEAHVPTISFTGGEPTIRHDLIELIRFANDIGMRTNLITNGIKCSNEEFVYRLADAGLKSAQVSLESHREDIHNSIVGNKLAYKHTLRGIKNLKSSGIHTHTNTTICQKNKNHLIPLIQFLKEEFDSPYLSMNMIIKTGIARDNDNMDINYSSIGDIIEPVIDYCEIIGMKFVWYSPTPYCLFNPVDHNLGSKSCACITGLLSVNPSGEILPCSSFERGVGNLLRHPFDYIWNSDEALYWRERKYIPPVCKKCEYEILCGGACPLYWENAQTFREIEEIQDKKPLLKNILWNMEKFLRVRSKGIGGINAKKREATSLRKKEYP